MKNVKFYLAAPVPQQSLARLYAEEIQQFGGRVVSNWIFDDQTGYSFGNMREKVMRDVADINACDVFVQFHFNGSMGGMFSELGYAVASGKRCYVVAEQPRSLFHWHEQVMVVGSFSQVLRVEAQDY